MHSLLPICDFYHPIIHSIRLSLPKASHRVVPGWIPHSTAVCTFSSPDLIIKHPNHWIFRPFTKYFIFGILVVSRITLFFFLHQHPSLLSHNGHHIWFSVYRFRTISFFPINLVKVYIWHAYVYAGPTMCRDELWSVLYIVQRINRKAQTSLQLSSSKYKTGYCL